tara:strand:+ start:2461 stop:2742 length:282 start_codon:yes stop_codon:yes gene_type:complete
LEATVEELLKGTSAGNIKGDSMGAIFKTIQDDQQESMLKTLHIGNTWEFRYFKFKAWCYGIGASICTGIATAGVDYLIIKTTEHSGIIGWLFG